MVVIQAQNYLDISDGSDYAGMNYSIVESWTPVYDLKTKNVATGVLDENGHAEFDLKMKNNRKYDLGIQTPDNVCYTEITLQERLDHEKNNTFNFNYAACGAFNLKYTNVNCTGNNDMFQLKYYVIDNPEIYIYRGYTSGPNYEWSEVFFIEGCQSYLGDFSEDIPVGDYKIEWRVIRSSGTTTGSDIFTVTENDSTTYLLEY